MVEAAQQKHQQTSMNTLSNPPTSSAVNSLPEFANHQTATALFGFSRSSLYNLASAGSIRSVNIRKPGNIKGKRLFDCASIRAYLNSASVNA
jgi:hypothetical protein